MRPGLLKNGNPAADPVFSGPKCGARCKGTGKRCQAPAMRRKNGSGYTRCRMHGGASTGPKTPEGRERCRKARWKHGRDTREAREKHRQAVRELKGFCSLYEWNLELWRIAERIEEEKAALAEGWRRLEQAQAKWTPKKDESQGIGTPPGTRYPMRERF